ncbi:MAG: glycosyltransferase family 2 protein [Actinobacteria bacterium]|nr:glycosyltransferase family 2 protein [Actinomycetota bacterium]
MSNKPDKVAVIVPAYNEEKWIGSVLEVLTKINIISEIIVVNDGSKDRTSEVASSYNVKVIDRDINGGKGAAMQMGIGATDAGIIAFIDADLIGISSEHIRNLIEPLIIDTDLMMTVGKFTGGRLTTDLAQAIVPFISGQRAIRREFLNGLPSLENTGFGVEVVMTQHAKQNKLKVKEVLIPDATHVMKEEKWGFLKGFTARMRMYGEIAKQVISRKNI